MNEKEKDPAPYDAAWEKVCDRFQSLIDSGEKNLSKILNPVRLTKYISDSVFGVHKKNGEVAHPFHHNTELNKIIKSAKVN